MTGIAKLHKLLMDDASRPSLMGDVEKLRRDPKLIFAPLNIRPDPWQEEVLKSEELRILLNCSRQSGKSQIMAALALLEAIKYPHAEVLLISRTMRQSVELLNKVKMLWRGLIGGKAHRRADWRPKPLLEESLYKRQEIEAKGWDGAALAMLGQETTEGVNAKATSVDGFPNGARITSLPGNPDNIVGFSAVTLLIIDEASRTSDELFGSVSPFMAATEAVHGRPGRMVVASTPFGKRGWFYEAWIRCERAEAAYKSGCAACAGDSIRNSAGREHSTTGGASGASTFTGYSIWLRKHWQLGYEGKEAQPPWKTYRVTAEQCPRITQEFLEEERAQIGNRWWQQEYACQFMDSIDSVFSHDLVQSMVKKGDGEARFWFED